MVATRAVAVPTRHADDVVRRLLAAGLVRRELRTTSREGVVVIPVRILPAFDLSPFEAHVVEAADADPRRRPPNPVEALRRRLRDDGVPVEAVPSGWERIGEVIVLRLSPAARGWEAAIGRATADVLGARTVVEDRSGVHGPFRTPDVRVLWGEGTETVHAEGGVRFLLDVAQVMLSSGNVAERVGALAGRLEPGQIVVDLFAGIGYFSLPVARRFPQSTVYACEANPIAFRYLVENVRINRVANVVPHAGNCRKVAPRGIADWVLMGHFDAPRFLDVAFECLREEGTIVVHSLHPKEVLPDAPIEGIRAAAVLHRFAVLDARVRIVKAYAPGIVHAATEARVARRPKGLSSSNVSGEPVTR
jgi:tRNA wybutosine-synthesizing protein 2